MSSGTRDDQGISQDDYRILNVKFSTWYDKRRHEGLFNRLKCTYIDLLDNATFSNNKEKRTIVLLNALHAAGKLSRNNLKLLHDTITITNQVGLRSELENLLPSFPYAGVSSFTQHRQRVLKFFSNLSDTDVDTINARFNDPIKQYSDRWDMLFDLEKSRGIINKEKLDEFIENLEEIGVETTPYEPPGNAPARAVDQTTAQTPAHSTQASAQTTQNPGPETPYQTPSPILTSSLVLEQELSDFEPCDELKQPNGFSIEEERMADSFSLTPIDIFLRYRMNKEFLKSLLPVSKWYDERNYTDQLRVMYKDKIPSVSALREAKSTMGLFKQLENGGHLSATNTKILVDTINVTGTHGVLGVSKHLQDIYDNTDHRVTSFSSYRQSLMQFGNSLSESDVTKLSALLNGSRNEWTAILDLEESGILNEDELQQFIKHLKENGIRGGAKTLERKRRKTNHPTKC